MDSFKLELKVFARPKTNTNLSIKTWTRKKTPLFVWDARNTL